MGFASQRGGERRWSVRGEHGDGGAPQLWGGIGALCIQGVRTRARDLLSGGIRPPGCSPRGGYIGNQRVRDACGEKYGPELNKNGILTRTSPTEARSLAVA